jgi:hypothetical protein
MKNKLNPKIFLFLLSVLLFAVLFFKCMAFLDPDFGWHLKMGEIIFRTGVPKTDQFTYTMPSFPHVDHEWLVDLVIYHVYSYGGFVLLSILYSLVLMAAIYIAVGNSVKNMYFYVGLILMAVGVIYPYFGVRHQALSWFYLAVFVRTLREKKIFERFKYFLPMLFLLWANTHGGFIAGLFILWSLIGFDVLTKKVPLRYLLIPIVSTLITFTNPYGEGLWREVFSSLTDSRLRWVINEWMPAIWIFDLSMLWFIAFALMSVSINRKMFRLSDLFILAVVFLQALISRRNVPIFVILALPFVSASVAAFIDEVQKDKISRERLIVGSKIFLGLVSLLTVVQVGVHMYSAKKFSEEVSYPKVALKYLDDNYPNTRVFADYAWGGYIIWKSPNRKVFIDGRMPSWKWKANISNESNDIMTEYLDVLNGDKPYSDVFHKYKVDVVMMPIPIEKTETPWDKLDKKIRAFFGKKTENYDFFESLKNDGWAEVYKDGVAVIYTKPS